MENIIDNKIVKFVVIGLLALLIVFMLITFPNKNIKNTNDSNVVSFR